MSSYNKEEQETSLVYDAETNTWRLFSCYPPHITKIKNTYGLENFEVKYIEGRESPLEVSGVLEHNQVSFRKGGKRKISEEQRQKQAERMRKLHQERKLNDDQ